MQNKQAKHTPGPLFVAKLEKTRLADGGGYYESVTTYQIRSPRFGWLADVLKKDDAHLIAAAPELLEVLKAMHKHFITETTENIGEAGEALEAQSMKVIAKAEGREEIEPCIHGDLDCEDCHQAEGR